MTDLYEDYRRAAAYCEQMADHAPTLQMRADWLRLAHRWLALISQLEEEEPGAFAALVRDFPADQGAQGSH